MCIFGLPREEWTSKDEQTVIEFLKTYQSSLDPKRKDLDFDSLLEQREDFWMKGLKSLGV